MTRQVVRSDQAPPPVGPYSQAVRMNGCLYLSGQIPLDPQTGNLVEGGLAEQTQQVLSNLSAVLHAAGLTFDNVVKVTIYTTELQQAATINEIYATYCSAQPPARAMVEVSRLPKGALVEIEAIACY